MSMLPARNALLSMKLTTWLDLVTHEHGEHPIGFNGIVNLHAQQTTYGGVHGGFPQLSGVHLAQAFVALTAGGALGFADEPVHGLAEVVGLFFFLTCSPSPRMTLAPSPSKPRKVLAASANAAVVGTMYEILRNDAALDVAVMPTADAQQWLVGANVKLSAHFSRNAGGVEFAQFGLQSGGAFSRVDLSYPGQGTRHQQWRAMLLRP